MEFEVRTPAPGRVVDATSARRLPFEPKGSLLDFRRELSAACRTLVAGPDEVLQAVYASADRSRVDIENVLTYNVGTGALRAAARNGLVLERSYDAAANGHPHQHRYELVPSETPWTGWAPGEPIASITLDAPARLFTEPKAGRWWLAARRGTVTTHTTRSVPPAAYTVRVRVTPPTGWRGSLVGLVKPVVDGLVAALHVHSGSTDEVVRRSAAVDPTLSATEFTRLLGSGRPAGLGAVRLVVPWGRTVQWLPADDGIVVLDVRLDHTRNAGRVSAEFDVATLVE